MRKVPARRRRLDRSRPLRNRLEFRRRLERRTPRWSNPDRHQPLVREPRRRHPGWCCGHRHQLEWRIPDGRQSAQGDVPSGPALRRDADRGRSRRSRSRGGVSLRLQHGRLLAEDRKWRIAEQCPPEERQPRCGRHERRRLHERQLLQQRPRRLRQMHVQRRPARR